MSKEAAPQHAAVSEQPLTPPMPAVSSVSSVPAQPQRGDAPAGLLRQMEAMMAALTADLSQLDADLQSSADRQAAADGADDPGPAGPGLAGPDSASR
jgi:hypothetical protein